MITSIIFIFSLLNCFANDQGDITKNYIHKQKIWIYANENSKESIHDTTISGNVIIENIIGKKNKSYILENNEESYGLRDLILKKLNHNNYKQDVMVYIKKESRESWLKKGRPSTNKYPLLIPGNFNVELVSGTDSDTESSCLENDSRIQQDLSTIVWSTEIDSFKDYIDQKRKSMIADEKENVPFMQRYRANQNRHKNILEKYELLLLEYKKPFLQEDQKFSLNIMLLTIDKLLSKLEAMINRDYELYQKEIDDQIAKNKK